MRRLALILCLCTANLSASPRTLYRSLQPNSVPQHLAYYQVYPDSEEGKQALAHAWQLLAGRQAIEGSLPEQLDLDPQAMLGIVNLVQGTGGSSQELSPSTLSLVHGLGRHLGNRKLKGHHVQSEEEVLALEPEEVDLARGLLLSQLGNDEDALSELDRYEAVLDLMALQIRATLPEDPTPQQLIRGINDFIFHKLRFRFPPQSLYAKDIDTYTFLPSVLDSHEGVCLGVTALYLCLAQRLELPLEIVTPPGHIYIRHRAEDGTITNIETTARGIHIPCDIYLGVNTRSLEQRTIKEVVGMTHFNHASVYWQQGRYEDAIAAYKKCFPYSPDHPLVIELLGTCYVAAGEEEKGRELLEKVRDKVPEHAVVKQTTTEDWLDGKCDAEGIRAIFLSVDETRESVLEKQQKLQNVLERYPEFRGGIFQLAVTWMQLHRPGEALETLERLEALDSSDPTVQYYMSMLYAQRANDPKAWDHFREAERLAKARDHEPKALEQLERSLRFHSPEPL